MCRLLRCTALCRSQLHTSKHLMEQYVYDGVWLNRISIAFPMKVKGLNYTKQIYKNTPLLAAVSVTLWRACTMFRKLEIFAPLMNASIATDVSHGTGTKHGDAKVQPRCSMSHTLVFVQDRGRCNFRITLLCMQQMSPPYWLNRLQLPGPCLS